VSISLFGFSTPTINMSLSSDSSSASFFQDKEKGGTAPSSDGKKVGVTAPSKKTVVKKKESSSSLGANKGKGIFMCRASVLTSSNDELNLC